MRPTLSIAAAAVVLWMAGLPRAALGYVEAAYSLGKVIGDSSNVLVMRVESVDRQKNLIIYRKIQDLKGTHPGDTIKHSIGQGGFHPREWQAIMAWADVGKNAVFFHNNSAGEVCLENYWYQAYAGEWWNLSHGEPYLLRTYAGKPERLATAVTAMLAGQEVTVPCMVDGDKNALQLRTAKIQRMRASMKIQDYDARRDFVEGGADALEFRPLAGMPGFSHFLALNSVGPGALGMNTADFNGDGKPDLCLYGTERVALLQNAGGSFDLTPLPLTGGARAATWADYDADGKADLLLATPGGPKLLHNGAKGWEDLSGALPDQDYYHTMAAAWIDYDGDGRPDVLLADGFRGLRLYRNKGPASVAPAPPQWSKWSFIGPFDNSDKRGFDAVYPPETEINLGAQYAGKGNERVGWREGSFRDGQVNDLRQFKAEHNSNCVIYLYREVTCTGAVEVPAGFGSDDTLSVWLNGQRIHAENVYRGCQPEQVALRLKLRAGKNSLLLKICQGDGEFAFYFSAKDPGPVVPKLFDDVSDAVGLGAKGVGSLAEGDYLAVADVNGDNRPDVLYSAGTGLLALNTPQGFVEVKNSGIAYAGGRVQPVFGDYDGDKRPDLFVPQRGVGRLFRNNGNGTFTDVTAQAGDLTRALGDARCAAWADFRKQGRQDLFVGCLRGPNRYFRNNGNGTFTEATDQIGLTGRIFNSCGLAVLDINNDKMPDVIFANAGQESTALLGSPTWAADGAKLAGILADHMNRAR
jgi:hypothetical protein